MKKKAKKQTGLTYYSYKHFGDSGNYRFISRFDETDGYVGITQWDPEKEVDSSRVLLSPKQVESLIRFVKRKK